MRAIASRVLFAAVCAVVGAGGALALSRGDDEKPVVKKVADEEWFPKAGGLDKEKNKRKWTLPPSAFPDVSIPKPKSNDPKDWEAYRIELEKRCPRLNGKTELKVGPADTTLHKLLKARLHQGALEYQENQKAITSAGNKLTRAMIPWRRAYTGA